MRISSDLVTQANTAEGLSDQAVISKTATAPTPRWYGHSINRWLRRAEQEFSAADKAKAKLEQEAKEAEAEKELRELAKLDP